jgi:hypothetical protein
MEPPAFTGTMIMPGAADMRWHIGACWFSGTAMPPSFATDEVIPERRVRLLAVIDARQKLLAITM